jgi:large subunit ribosomal protein L5
MIRIQEKIKKVIYPALKSGLKVDNVHALPSLTKVVVSVGIRSDLKDQKVIDAILEDLRAITGQKPVQTRSKKSISSFGIREGQIVGAVVTLRGKRMYDFVEKLFNATLPRIRDFRGFDKKGFDKQGNFSIGFRDQIPFPEISADTVKNNFGLQVTLTVKAESNNASREFLTLLGLPLKK